ncbi:hypothetical protein CAEBREN_14165 [Caenorhabditis brenneri]|uniref:BTB domain-containing protein n=1 Tax=Caenorhabditis brenneri TaxID=135651 RepID=G0MD23_CAEBE|nr:hypothetical protein CAEBREN_14165 [Caenorhabditis brenneri]
MEEPFEPFTITHVVRNLSDWFIHDRSDSKVVLQYNVPWKLQFKKYNEEFCVYLMCEKDFFDGEWSIKVKVELTLSTAIGKTYEMNVIEAVITRFSPWYCFLDLMSWRELVEEFAFDDQVILDVKVQIVEMAGVEKKKKSINFDDEDAKKLSDVTLCIGDEKFHLLARQSPYFHSMFFKDFKEATMEEVPLKDVSPEDFQCFLEVINLEPTLTDDCVENVLKLADMYEAKNVTRQCEEFLIHKSNHSDKKKLQMAGRFNLNDLKEQVFHGLRTKTDIRAATDPDLKNPEILKRLLDMALKYHY